MRSEVKEPTGSARYQKEHGLLTITTNVMKGTKASFNAVTYQVEDLHPDELVANPAFALFKLGPNEGGETVRTGEVWHVAVETYGPTCSCPHATFRGANSKVPCKHTKAMQAVGLLPKPRGG